MSTPTEQNKAIVRRNYETADKNDLTAFSEQLAPDVVIHLPGMPSAKPRGAHPNDERNVFRTHATTACV